MARLHNANAQAKLIRALRSTGFEEFQGAKHTIMAHPDGRHTTIPRHPRINPFTLKSILKQCGLSEQEYLRLY